jgi:von Willebrand factor type A domain-containing protein
MKGERLSGRTGWSLVVAACVALAGAACDASSRGSNGDGGSGGNGTGGIQLSASGGDITASGGSGTSVGGGCVSDNKTAEKLPLDMYIMLDQSGSMADPVQMGGDKWGAVTTAFNTFVMLPSAAGMGVGIQYFPLDSGQNCPLQCFTDPDCGPCGPCFGAFMGFPGFCMNASGSSCDVNAYATPEVPIAPLPGNAGAITASISMHSPGGGTPTSAALQGAIQQATTYANANPDHVVIVTLATDGDPTDCDPDINNIAAIAAAGLAGTPSIRTFVIGVGASLTNLNQIAAAGGTMQAYIVDTNQNVTQQFVDALEDIQGTALGCVYALPDPPPGEMLDYGKVNVEYTPGDGSPPQTIPNVASEADCPANGDGWYYDDNSAPTQIILCDFTCSKVSLDATGKMSIVYGCATVLQ